MGSGDPSGAGPVWATCLTATCRPAGAVGVAGGPAWALPADSEVNKAINNSLVVKLEDTEALDGDNRSCMATQTAANLVRLCGAQTTEAGNEEPAAPSGAVLCRGSHGAKGLALFLALPPCPEGGRTMPPAPPS